MRPSIAGALQARLHAFEQALELSGGDLGHFFRPALDRLPLATALAHEVSVPMEMSLDGQFSLHLVETPSAGNGTAQARDVIRTCQWSPDLRPSKVQGWLQRGEADLRQLCVGIIANALAEVGRGPGGEELARLVLIHLQTEIHRTLDEMNAQDGWRFVFCEVARDAVAEALDDPRVDESRLSARLAYQMRCLLNPMGMGVDPQANLRNPANGYRSLPEAYRHAGRIIRGSLEGLPLSRAVDVIARRLLSEDKTRDALRQRVLLERVRDLCLVGSLGTVGDAPNVGSGPDLTASLYNERTRRSLEAWAEGVEPRLHKPLLQLMQGNLQNEAAAIESQATLAARGALLARLESRLHYELAATRGAPKRPAPGAYLRGRAYQLDAREPLFHLKEQDEVGLLFVSWSGLLAELRPRAADWAAAVRHEIGPVMQDNLQTVRWVYDGDDGCAVEGSVYELLARAEELIAWAVRWGRSHGLTTDRLPLSLVLEFGAPSMRVEDTELFTGPVLQRARERCRIDPAAETLRALRKEAGDGAHRVVMASEVDAERWSIRGLWLSDAAQDALRRDRRGLWQWSESDMMLGRKHTVRQARTRDALRLSLRRVGAGWELIDADAPTFALLEAK